MTEQRGIDALNVAQRGAQEAALYLYKSERLRGGPAVQVHHSKPSHA
ncbi:hypothetical protein LN050_05500 [Comamonadaceae bacterium M7527]|nr:hypothetical protein LN050_05500 [Comamonadaceae bacterium M7527]